MGRGDYTRVAEQLTGVSAAVVEAAGVGPGMRVLDLGAGSGNTALLAAGRGAEVTAVDLTDDLFGTCRQRAAGHLKGGLAIAAETGDETSAAYYLEGLAAVAGQQDNPERAVRLLAAARSLLDTSGSGWLHAYVPRVPHDGAVLASLRSRLGVTAFEQAQAWGASAGGRRARESALE